MRYVWIFSLLVFSLMLFLTDNTVFGSHENDNHIRTDDPAISIQGNKADIIWQVHHQNSDSEITFTQIIDGKTIIDPKTIIKESRIGFTKIISQDDNIVIVYEQYTPNNQSPPSFFILTNHDGGKTFSEPKLLLTSEDVYYDVNIVEIVNEKLYVFGTLWTRAENTSHVFYSVSDDFGKTFSEPTKIFNQGKVRQDIVTTVSNDVIYLLVDDEKDFDEKGHLYLFKVLADGTITERVSVNNAETSITNQKIAVSGDDVYVSWLDRPNDTRWYSSFAASHDGGMTFEKSKYLPSDPDSIDTYHPDGLGLFVIGETVNVLWESDYWDGENQTIKTFVGTSDNKGKNFQMEELPANSFLGQYGRVLTLVDGAKQYYLAPGLKNYPYENSAMYFNVKGENEKYSEIVDILQDYKTSPGPVIADVDRGFVHLVTDAHDSNCILYQYSSDEGKSFNPPTDLAKLETGQKCLGITEDMPSPRLQMKSGVEIENIQCSEDLSRGYLLVLKNNMKPVCVAAASYDKMLDRGFVSDKSFETISLSAARNYLLSHPKTSSGIDSDSLDLQVYMTRHSVPPAFIIRGSFDSTSPIYDGDTDPKNHTIEIILTQNNKIHLAKIDDTFLLTESSSTENRNPRSTTIVSPTLYTILSPGDRINNKGLIPLVITEVSEGGYPDTTHWTFQSIGYHGDNRDKLWGFLPDQYRVSETVDQNGNDAIDRERMPENFGIPMPLFIFPLLCNGEERVEGESGWHYTLPTRTDTDMVYFRSTDKGIYPDENGIYDIRFVSMFKPKVELLPNVETTINETVLCLFEKPMNDATHAYYTHLQYKMIDKWTASYYSSESGITKDGPHAHATILVKVFGDRFDFSQSQLHLKDPKINLEPAQPDLIHRNSDDATIRLFFETLGMELNQECLVFPDGRDFCSDEEYVLKFYVNDEKKDDISQYVISEDDRILVSYDSESSEDIEKQLAELESMAKYNYFSLYNLMTMDVGTVKDGTYNGDLGFKTAEKLMRVEMNMHTEHGILENEENVVQYTSEEIFERIGEIEAENIKMYKFGPELYEKYVSAKKDLEDAIKNDFDSKGNNQNIPESVQMALVEINPQSKSIEIILQKNLENNPEEIKRYKSLVEEIIPKDIQWDISFRG